MKLTHIGLEARVSFERDCVNEWIIESPDLFMKYIRELLNQTNGYEGNFVLSEEDKIEKISKSVEVIINPFDVDVNDKKILNKIYDNLKSISIDEKNYVDTREITHLILRYIINIANDSDYIMDIDNEIDMTMLFKAAGVRLEQNPEDFIGNILKYIELTKDVLKKKLVVLVNFRNYINDIQYNEFIKMSRYKKLNILLMENTKKNTVSDVKQFVLDKDECEIF